MRIKRRLIASCALVALALLPGCGRRPNAELPAASMGQFNYSQIDEPRHLDPAFVKDLYEGIVSGFIYDGLVVFGKGTNIEPGLAARWEISPDGRVYTFHLRDASFSDGRPVTSADVRYSLTRILRPETVSDRKWVLDRIEGAAAVTSGSATELSGLVTPDQKTVIITLREPYPVFLTMLAMPNAVIIASGSAGTDKPSQEFDQHPMGTGPWVLEKWVHDQKLEFRANEHFWGGKPKLGALVYQVQTDATARRKAFERGLLDVVQVDFASYDSWSSDPKRRAQMVSVQELRTDFIGFVCNKPVLADRRVREAISVAINTKAIFEDLQKGRGVLAHGPIPPGVAGYRGEIAPREFNMAKARALLVEAGSPKLHLSLWYRDEALNSEIVQSVKSDLEKAGIQIDLVPRDQSALRMGVYEGQPDLYLGSWTLDYPDPENAIFPPFHSNNIPRQGNGAHFRNAEVDRLIDAARREPDAKLRIEKYAAAEDAIIRECPWVFLFHRKTYYAVQPDVKGFAPAIMYNADRFTEVAKTEKAK